MVEHALITEGQRKAWSSGDLAKLAARLPPLYAELLCEAARLRPAERVLDVAAGTGTTSIAATRRFCDVVAVDFVGDFLAKARQLAECEDLELETREADAQDLPFVDDSFDVVLSTFGVMFASDQQRVADELLRVVRSTGRIGVTAWTPDGLIGRYARTIGKYLPPPQGVRSPFIWGTEEGIRELFGERIRSVNFARRAQPFRYPSVEFAVEYFRAWYGPARAAFGRLDENDHKALHDDMVAVWENANEADDGTLVAHADYLECVIETT
ncbi:class I SAM-dependent methyltransferase [Amycolatopsis taiwanensis]|uniref:Methyltransferase type 11 n=1 Tax=Amycolatopsis taiwanensis TaxID=342230 RepID=A0A9W6R8T2_9PSEU|nr:class I SAM-dependent methyltransferase [Amycolatopsis taiwanensis]GLY70993.1 methyltransferase type 11 [Amycolatopsis taiwanensis]